ncbi:proline dehydrogenase [Saccharomonospora glauca K62]|uniref:proline dehydrogenase n=1 Tax=Saccharomonospora glauca K62 TaxID=928724 RepID=I1CX55_9PSEU|nr:proline dehydrogenase [Saccharomonospora glauca K62]
MLRTRKVSVVEPLRSLILAAADSDVARRMATTAPGIRQIVARFVPGETVDDALRAVKALAADGRCATLDYLGEYTRDPTLVERTVRTYLRLLDELSTRGLSDQAEVSVKLSALTVDGDRELAARNLGLICEAAEQCGTTVTVDMEDHTTTDATLGVVERARRTWPWVGAVVQSYLHRTESDVASLAHKGSRVRLCKGAYAEPADVAYTDTHEVDLSYVRCANLLLEGGAYPMFATHDPRLVRLLRQRTRWYGMRRGSYEYQMLYGVRPDEQRRLAAEGETVRVYVPFGEQWYGYLMRRLAERPANLALFLRALAIRS